MKNPIATFYPDVLKNLKITLVSCFIIGLIVYIVGGLKDGFSLKEIEMTPTWFFSRSLTGSVVK